MPRFAILEHDHPSPHFDLLLEAGDVLWTWRMLRLPQIGDVLDAERIGDHRLAYLDYEGPISGDRGTVIRREYGELTWTKCEDDRLDVRLDGTWLHARISLTRSESKARWRLVCSS